ncbi:hypothetical protein MATL_G00100950 [Megalops atlanticus]|uniref:Uncharacterized protein n=1 Tax=Megalops atlanticus TaxID=7932 RepID=A0A9D3Q6Z4_MEGAT|nr:hypothetical protein MATL_G00100950 [Megalops atlanticus]
MGQSAAPTSGAGQDTVSLRRHCPSIWMETGVPGVCAAVPVEQESVSARGSVTTHRFGGKPCLGGSVEHQACEAAPCAKSLPTFRDLQCQSLNRHASKRNANMWTATINDKVIVPGGLTLRLPPDA